MRFVVAQRPGSRNPDKMPYRIAAGTSARVMDARQRCSRSPEMGVTFQFPASVGRELITSPNIRSSLADSRLEYTCIRMCIKQSGGALSLYAAEFRSTG